MSEHAKLSPSHAASWVDCPGSVALSENIPNTSSAYADEGTKAHSISADILLGKPVASDAADPETADYIMVYVNAVRRAAEGKVLLVEQRVDVSHWTTEKDAKGTADAVIVDIPNCAIEIHDLKFGRGIVVDAENNYQLMLYALGVLDLVEGIYLPEVKNIKLVINQPRRDHYSEWIVSREDLLQFGAKTQKAGAESLAGTGTLTPSPKACQWCRAKHICPALEAQVHQAVFDDFAEGSSLEGAPLKDPNAEPFPSPATLELVETWVKTVRGRIFEKLQKFEPVAGWKMVLGRPGNRSWLDREKAEELAKKIRIPQKDSHDFSLKTPTQLEKVVPEKRWAEFALLIGRSNAQPSMVAESDKRPAMQPPAAAEEFPEDFNGLL